MQTPSSTSFASVCVKAIGVLRSKEALEKVKQVLVRHVREFPCDDLEYVIEEIDRKLILAEEEE